MLDNKVHSEAKKWQNRKKTLLGNIKQVYCNRFWQMLASYR